MKFLGFAESAGLAAVAHGPDQALQNANLVRKYGRTPSPISLALEIMNNMTQLWQELGTALTSLADGPTCYWRTQASWGWPPMLRAGSFRLVPPPSRCCTSPAPSGTPHTPTRC